MSDSWKIAVGGLALMIGLASGFGPVLADHRVKRSTGHQVATLDASVASPFRAADPAPTAALEKSQDTLTAFVARRLENTGQNRPEAPNGIEPASLTARSENRLDSAQITHIAERCAPSAPASALVSIARVESGFEPLTIGVNGAKPRVYHPRTVAQAVSLAQNLIAQGRNIDLGVAQINSRNLAGLKLSVADAFDPCRNLAAAAEVLNRGYERALSANRTDRPILQMAYSIYNTGDTERGLVNGYVDKVEVARRHE